MTSRPKPICVLYGDSGSQLSLAVSSSDLGLSNTTSSVDASLLPNSSALIQTTADASSPLVGGSARLSSDPGVTGFLIFQFNPSGADVLVSAQAGNASSYLVAFDQTNGLTTALSLANSTTQQITVTGYLRDQNGNNLASKFITLPPQGHQSFVLTSVFPEAANHYGTVQFVPGSGQQIGVVGIRYTPGGAVHQHPRVNAVWNRVRIPQPNNMGYRLVYITVLSPKTLESKAL